MTRVADACGVSIAGGDTVRGEFTLDITVVGSVLPGQAVRRDGASAGDVICVSGELGRSEAGRRLAAEETRAEIPEAARSVALRGHRTPRPRFDVSEMLRGLRRRHVDLDAGTESYDPVRPTAMMDVSDGLAVDLLRMCAASRAGCRLDADRIPVDAAAREIARAAKEPEFALALGGGEDFELLFTMPPESLDLLLDAADRAGIAITPIGRMVPASDGCHIVEADGRAQLLRMQGWDHFNPAKPTPASMVASPRSTPSRSTRPH
jgi:thiamine-monophosphate kinase